MKNSKSLSVNVEKTSTLISTKQLAAQLHSSSKVIIENAKKCLPNKKIINGKPTYWNEAEVTVLVDFVKANSHRTDITFTKLVKVTETSLTPALKIKKAMELMQEGYEEEMARLKAEKNRVIQESDNLKFELTEASRIFGENQEQIIDFYILKKYIKKEPYGYSATVMGIEKGYFVNDNKRNALLTQKGLNDVQRTIRTWNQSLKEGKKLLKKHGLCVNN